MLRPHRLPPSSANRHARQPGPSPPNPDCPHVPDHRLHSRPTSCPATRIQSRQCPISHYSVPCSFIFNVYPDGDIQPRPVFFQIPPAGVGLLQFSRTFVAFLPFSYSSSSNDSRCTACRCRLFDRQADVMEFTFHCSKSSSTL